MHKSIRRVLTRLFPLSTAVFFVFVLCLMPLSLMAFAQDSATVTALHSFEGSSTGDGAYPETTLTLGPDGDFYGTTAFGGSTHNDPGGDGTAFKIDSSGQITILHAFRDGTVPDDGLVPTAGLVLGTDGNFYGDTEAGGTVGEGIIYKMTPSGQLTILHSFCDGTVANDARGSTFGMVQGADGNFYGMTEYGGSFFDDGFQYGAGAIFKMTPSGQVTILHPFGDGSVANDGLAPFAGLIQGSDGNFYGTTAYGGSTTGQGFQSRGYGTAFKITPAGQMTILHSFGDGSVTNDGQYPDGNFVQGPDGNFYAMATYGGSAGNGAIFKMTPSGQVTILYSFEANGPQNDGIGPNGSLIYGTDGNYYGLATHGGPENEGSIFKMTPSGQVTYLHFFGDGSTTNDGAEPFYSLVEGLDGNLYGTTDFGGAANVGVVFKAVLSPVPVAPMGLIATVGKGQVGLTWNASAGATSYNIYRSTSSDEETLYQSNVSATSDTDTNVSNGTIYYYEVTAVNGAGESGKSNEASAMLFAPIYFLSGLQMFSIPFDYSSTPLDTLFGYTNAELAVWSPTSNSYALSSVAPADHVRLGQGYWVRFPRPLTITTPGTPADANQNFDIALAQGWNMIGDPFQVSIPVANLTFADGTLTFSQATTGANPLIGATIWGYSQGTNSYTAATFLAPEQGYWVFAFSATVMGVPHP